MLVCDKDVNGSASIAPFLAGHLDGPQPYQGRPSAGLVPLSGTGPTSFRDGAGGARPGSAAEPV
jgi:hypothetical protein